MIPDIVLKDYYLQFIHDAKVDAVRYKEKLDITVDAKNNVREYIATKIDEVKESFNIDLNKYEKEWINSEYNTNEALYNVCIKLLNSLDEHSNKILLLQVIKYCNLLRTEYRCRRAIELTNTRKNLRFIDYRKHITNYYNSVHKCVLQGMGYKFSNGIGTFVCNHWKLDKNKMKNKPRLDYKATQEKKKELLAKGVKLYDDKEAAWYAARKIPYDAVDYRVYRTNTSWYEFTFIKSQIAKSGCYDYKHTEYIATKYRGMSYTDMAEKLCKTEEDIYKLQVDIKYKLNILLYKDPTKYLNFVRNASQCKYEPGAHNS